MQRSCPTLAFKPHTLFLPTSYFLSPHFLKFLAVFLYFLLSIPPLTRSGFFNEMMEVFELGALNYYILSHLIQLTLSVFRNPTSTHLPLSASLNSLLCDLIVLTPSLAFFLPMTCTLVAVSSFSLGRAYPHLNFLP